MTLIPTVGMIVPLEGNAVPPEAPAMYPAGVRFIAEGLGLQRLTPEGYDAVIDKVGDLSIKLVERGATAIALMGTSLSFYRGIEFNARLVRTIQEKSGLPATTMSNAIVEALRRLGAARVAVATAYVDEVNKRLESFLTDSGFSVGGIASLGIDDAKRIFDVTEAALVNLADRAFAIAPTAQALFISCGGLRTLHVSRRIEDRLGLPVVSSATAGAWAAMCLTGHDGRVKGYGRFLELAVAPTAGADRR